MPWATSMSPETFTALRKLVGLTQRQLAEAWGIRRPTISDWERGKHPVPDWAARLIELEVKEKQR